MKSNSYREFIRAAELLDTVYTGEKPVPYVVGMVSTPSGKVDIHMEGGDRWTYNPDTDVITKG